MTKRKYVPATASLEAAAVDLAEHKGDEPREFSMEAYTGAVFDVGFGPAVIDLASLAYPADGIPILRQHNFELFVGRSTEIVKGQTLTVKGLLFSGVAEADEVARISDQGGKWQASVGISISGEGLEWIEEGETCLANGQSLAGPFVLLKNCSLTESSFVPLGADSNTSAVALCDGASSNAEHSQEGTMATDKKDSGLALEQKRVADLSAAFEKHPAFALKAITKGWSVIEAKAERADELEAKLAQQEADHSAALAKVEADNAKALELAKANTPASPAAALGGFASDNTSSNPAGSFEDAVATECAKLRNLGSTGLSRGGGLKLHRDANIRALAVQNVAKKNPELHAAYLQAHNAAVLTRQGR